MGQHHIAPVGAISEPARGVDGVKHRQRHVGDRLLAGFIHLAGDIDFLRTECGDINVHLRVSDVLR